MDRVRDCASGRFRTFAEQPPKLENTALKYCVFERTACPFLKLSRNQIGTFGKRRPVYAYRHFPASRFRRRSKPLGTHLAVQGLP